MKKKVLILGAGPSGLMAAYKLLKENKNYDVTILEKQFQIGGLCKTEQFQNIKLDYGVHFYRMSQYQEINDIIYHLIPIEDCYSKYLTQSQKQKYVKNGKNADQENNIMLINKSSSNIYFDNKFYEYPIRINFETIKKIGFINAIIIVFSYLKVLIKKQEENNLENYYINRYGKKFYEMFFHDYTYKICGVDPKDIDIDWGKQRIRETSLINIVKEKLFHKEVNNEPSLIEEYYYPKYGCGEVYQKLSQEIKKMGGKIITDSYATKIELKENKVEKVTYISKKKEKHLIPDYLISSITLKDFASLLPKNSLQKNILQDIKKLPYRDLILVNIIVSKKQMEQLNNYHMIKDNSWVFIQDPNIRFGRIKIANNWSKYMLGEDYYKNKVVLTLEYCCDSQDSFCQLSDKEIMRIVRNELEILELYPNNGIEEYKIDRVKNAYPAYYGSYKNRKRIIKSLDKLEQIYFIGRNGQHQYIDMDKAMYTGLKASESIIENKNEKKDVWL